MPRSIELADASKLLSRDRLITHRKTGSLALASDIFRYELMAEEAGIYVDCDCFCIRPLLDADLIVSEERDDFLGTAVLKLPSDSPLTEAMRAIGTSRAFIPPWEKRRRQRGYRLRAALGRPKPLTDMKWGTMGPLALTYYAKKFGLMQRALPSDVVYPVSYHHASLLRDPDISLDELITSRTRVVHLWNEIQRRTQMPPPQGSSLAGILESLDEVKS